MNKRQLEGFYQWVSEHYPEVVQDYKLILEKACLRIDENIIGYRAEGKKWYSEIPGVSFKKR